MVPKRKYMPLCLFGRTTLSDLRSLDEQMRWADRFEECWDVNEVGTAYWKYCLECHKQRCPHDTRHYGNRYTRPAPSWMHMCLPLDKAPGKRQLIMGDFLSDHAPARADHDRGRESRRCWQARPSTHRGRSLLTFWLCTFSGLRFYCCSLPSCSSLGHLH